MSPFARTRLIIHASGVAAMAGVLVAGYMGVARPLVSREREVVLLRQQASQLKSEAGMLDAASDLWQARLDEWQAALKDVQITLQPVSRLNARLAAITSIAQETRLTLDRVEPGQPIEQGGKSRVHINLSGQGPTSGCSDLLERLHTQFPDMRIIGLSLNSSPGQESASFSIRLVWYAVPNAESASAHPASPTPKPAASMATVSEDHAGSAGDFASPR